MDILLHKLHIFPKHNFYGYIMLYQMVTSLFYHSSITLIFHENNSDFFINTNYSLVNIPTLKFVYIFHYFQRQIPKTESTTKAGTF